MSLYFCCILNCKTGKKVLNISHFSWQFMIKFLLYWINKVEIYTSKIRHRRGRLKTCTFIKFGLKILKKICLVQIHRLNEKWGQWFSRKSRFLFAAVLHIPGSMKTFQSPLLIKNHLPCQWKVTTLPLKTKFLTEHFSNFFLPTNFSTRCIVL